MTLHLSACVTTNTANKSPKLALTTEKKPIELSRHDVNKNPLSVTLYTGKRNPNKPYIILGKESVSKFNRVGIKRQEANIRDAMRHVAATLGGDAVINISHDANSVTGTVIAYEKTQDTVHLQSKKINIRE